VAFALGNTVLATFTATPSPNPLQVGPDNGPQNQIAVDFFDARASALGVGALNVATTSGARNAIGTIDAAIETVSGYRASIGIAQRRLESAANDMAAQRINITAARSRIEDTDMASDMSELVRAQIVAQTSTAALAQANALPQAMLTLLRGVA
jgi:flagellin